MRGIEPSESCDVSGMAGCPVATVEEVEIERWGFVEPLFWAFDVDDGDGDGEEDLEEAEDLGGRRSFPRLSVARKTLRMEGEEEEEKEEEK